jgi:hypothetical protein
MKTEHSLQVQQALAGVENAAELLRSLLASIQPPQPERPQPASPTSLQPFAWGKRFDLAEKKFLLQTAADFSWHPDWLPTCMAFETAETFDPAIKNPGSSGSGLIQFMDETCEHLSQRWDETITTAMLRKMTRMEQLPWVWKYFKMKVEKVGNAISLEDVYMLIYWPAAVGRGLDTPLHTKDTKFYAPNKGLDINKDGIITKREAGRLVRSKLDKGLLPENYG